MTRFNVSAGAGTFWKPGRRDGVDQAPFLFYFLFVWVPYLSRAVGVLLSTVLEHSSVGYFDSCTRKGMHSDTLHDRLS